MEQTYVATFFSHFDAVQFSKHAKGLDIVVKLMPVPRKVSSSCGTGAQFETGKDPAGFMQEGVDKIFRLENGSYSLVCEVE